MLLYDTNNALILITTTTSDKTRIAILGGGPSGLFMFKRLVESGNSYLEIDIFERKNILGAGMPYSKDGANDEHITNVSGNEIPELVTSISEWIKTISKDTVDHFHIDPEKFNDYKVLPRLLFGQYLNDQFNMLIKQANQFGIVTQVHFNSQVTDIIDDVRNKIVEVEVNVQGRFKYDHVIICTGHNWPITHEGKIDGYFDSPYPPSKLAFQANHTVAIKGSSLTAIDAIRTLARKNGGFTTDSSGKLQYKLHEASPKFKLIMHSRNGMLPAIRFHLEDSHLLKDSILSKEELAENRQANEGFLSLDYVFEKNFKRMIKAKEPEFFAKIEHMKMEEFVGLMMELRERLEPFQLFQAEYAEAEQSIKRKESVYWKEMLAVLSFAMNYPAKYFSAEDMQRLQKVLMPLISIVIAFVPQSSVEEMLALHQAGLLEMVSVGDDSYVEPLKEGGIIYHYRGDDGIERSERFRTFVDCVGQPHLNYEDLPYKSLVENKTVSPAKIWFRENANAEKALALNDNKVGKDAEGNYYLRVPGITINDNFQAVDQYGALNERIYVMAVPYIGGYNPDYSGLDFCEAASASILKSILKQHV
ncbi:MAG: hypothetical protein EOO43_04730 [Flavobacterium sp.]|nr:MAG: hypothetical protein EOO43_04730 [Flavobacterium sp.]